MLRHPILVVDDNAEELHALAASLEILGHRVHRATSGHEALGLLERGLRVGAIITDFRMPAMDGLDLSAKARQEVEGIPVILVTGDKDGVDDALSQGSLALLKPFSIDALDRVVNEALEQRGQSPA